MFWPLALRTQAWRFRDGILSTAVVLHEPRVAASTLVSPIRLPQRAPRSWNPSALPGISEGLSLHPLSPKMPCLCSTWPRGLWNSPFHFHPFFVLRLMEVCLHCPLSTYPLSPTPGLGNIISQASQGAFIWIFSHTLLSLEYFWSPLSIQSVLISKSLPM